MIFKNNEVALITGGSTGIGLATVKLFSERGANVIFCGRSIGKGEAAQRNIAGSRYIKCDVSNQEEVDSMFERIREEYGRLDIAVNNAGISKSGKFIPEYSVEDFNEIVETNVKGLFLCLQKELEMMKRQKKGAIVNVASVLGVKAHTSKNALYTMTKHAVVGLTKEAALEYALTGVRVNAVLPAYTETEIISHHLSDSEKRRQIEKLHPIGRLIQPEEVARAILFLSTESASAMTGALMPVDGGCLAN